MHPPHSQHDLHDRTLLSRIAAGDSRAAGELIRRYEQSLILPLSRRILHDPADAEEVPAQLFLRLVEQSGSEHWPPRNIRAWLVTVTRHLATDIKRSTNAQRKRAIHQRTWLRHDKAPDEELLVCEIRDALYTAIDQLPHDSRAAVELLDLRDLPIRQAVETLGVSRATLYRRRSAALEQLRSDRKLRQLARDNSQLDASGTPDAETTARPAPSNSSREKRERERAAYKLKEDWMRRNMLNDWPRDMVLLLIVGMPLVVILGWGWYATTLVIFGVIAAVATFNTF